MDAYSALLQYFNNFLPLTKDEEVFIRQIFIEKPVKKRTQILKPGEVSQLNSFVVEGCFKMYLMDPSGKAHNLQFAIENWWIGDIGSFHAETPSRLYIEAMEDSLLLQVSKNDQLELFTRFPKFNQIFRVFTENALVAAQRRILQNIGSTAEERYLDFAQRYPQLFNRISNVQIASYLGVTPEFLSTIRKRIVQK